MSHDQTAPIPLARTCRVLKACKNLVCAFIQHSDRSVCLDPCFEQTTIVVPVAVGFEKFGLLVGQPLLVVTLTPIELGSFGLIDREEHLDPTDDPLVIHGIGRKTVRLDETFGGFQIPFDRLVGEAPS